MTSVLGIHGSPRKGGNTEILLDEALAGAEAAGAEVEKIRLAKLKFKACQACGGCDETGKCKINDDMQLLYPKFINGNKFIIASPIFFKSISALTKSMVDRFQCLWVAKYVLKDVPWDTGTKRLGAFISTCGSDRRDMFEPGKAVIRSLYVTLDIKYAYELLVDSIDEKGEICDHPGILEQARQLGRKLVTGE